MTTLRAILHRMGDAPTIELTRPELEALLQTWDEREEIRYQLSQERKALIEELSRVRRICRPLWRAARQIREGMTRAMRAARAGGSGVPVEAVDSWAAELALQLRPRQPADRRR